MTDATLSVGQIRDQLARAEGRSLALLISKYRDDPRTGVRAAVAAAEKRHAAGRSGRAHTRALYKLHHELREQGYGIIAGVDEVGRGALAGPVTCAAVILAEEPAIEGLDDSKCLTRLRREELSAVIRAQAVAVSVAHVPAQEIDALGMTAALRRGFGMALAGLGTPCDHVLLDGLPLRLVEHETAVVRGDSSVAEIAAASIIAKVTRDALMRSLAEMHPEYGFEENKGYGTREHIEAIAEFGLCTVHRRSFTPGGGTEALF